MFLFFTYRRERCKERERDVEKAKERETSYESQVEHDGGSESEKRLRTDFER